MGKLSTRQSSVKDIQGLSLWLKADAGVALNGSRVTGWADQSTSENNAIARTGNATLINNSINLKPAIRFTGDSNFITNSFFPINYHTPITMICVSKASASTAWGNQATARYLTSVTNNSGYEYGLAYGTEFPNFSNTHGISFLGSSDIESAPMGENEVALTTSINDGSKISFYIDGVLIGTANPDPTIIQDTSSNISTLQSGINSARSSFPNSFLVIYLKPESIYPASATPLVLSSNMALIGNGAMIAGSQGTTAESLIRISPNSSFVSISETNLSGYSNIYGIQGSGVSRIHVDTVNINGSGKDGIYLQGSGSNIFNNQITINNCQTSFAKSQGHAGVRISDATQAVCTNNITSGNSIGILIESNTYSTVFNNQSNFNTLTGIAIINSTGCKIAKNICSNNPVGVTVLGNINSQFNFFAENEVQGAQTGFLVGSSANILYENKINTNLNPRISFTGAGINRIFITDPGYPLVASQQYFYPPTASNQHNDPVVNGKSRTNVNTSATTLSEIKSAYDAARASNPNDFIALHLTAPEIVGDATVALNSYTSVIIDGKINLNPNITAFTSNSEDYISISSGIIFGGNIAGRHGLSFKNCSRIMIQDMQFNNFGDKNIRVNDSDVIVFSGCTTPCMIKDCAINSGAARGIWIKGDSISSTAGFVLSNNAISNMNMDGIDFDITTSNSLAIDNVCSDNIRYGIFTEEGANLNHIINNTCSNNQIGLNIYSNANGNTIRNSFISNTCISNETGIRFGALSPLQTSQNFAFNNTISNSTIFAINAQNTGSQNYISQNYLYQNASDLGSTTSAVFFNNSPQGVTGNGQSTVTNSLGNFAIGSEIILDKEDDYFSTCDIAEVLIYNRSIDESERKRIEFYLNSKYSIYSEYNTPKISINKQNLGGGKISLYKTPPKFLYFGVPLLVSNLPSDANPGCDFSIFNRTWIYLGAPSFRYRPIDSISYFITTPLTPEGYGGNGSYQIRDSDDVYFTNSYNNTDKFPSDNWQLGYYLINNCSQYTTVPIFALPNPNAVILYNSGTGNPLTYSGDGLSGSHLIGGLSGGGEDLGSWTVTFKIKKAGVLYYSFNLESEANYDYADSNVNGNTIFAYQSGYIQSNGNINVNIDDIITITYSKDESVSTGFDGIQFDFYIV